VRAILFIFSVFLLLQCDIISPEVEYSRELENAYITDFELVTPFTFRSDSFMVPAAHFRVAGETGAVYDVYYQVFGSIWFCGEVAQNPVEIIAEKVLIAEMITISSNTVYLGVGHKGLSVESNTNRLYPGVQWFPAGLGVKLFYRNDKKEMQISKSESYEYLEWLCQ
jgi:hypothetical protein